MMKRFNDERSIPISVETSPTLRFFVSIIHLYAANTHAQHVAKQYLKFDHNKSTQGFYIRWLQGHIGKCKKKSSFQQLQSCLIHMLYFVYLTCRNRKTRRCGFRNCLLTQWRYLLTNSSWAHWLHKTSQMSWFVVAHYHSWIVTQVIRYNMCFVVAV